MPKISIILTSFNHEKYIRHSIDSVLNQTFTDFELIIWDDASTDDSWSIIQGYQDPRIKAFQNTKQRRGIWGINKSITELSSAKYIAIHHSDDVWHPEKLEKQVSFFEKNEKYGAVFTWAQIIDENGNDLKINWFTQENKSREQWLYQLFVGENHFNHPSVLIKREVYKKVGCYRYGFAQIGDAEMWSRVLLQFPMHVIEERLTLHRFFSDKSNTSGDTIEVTIRTDNEWEILRENFLTITDFEFLVAIFPNLERFRNNQGHEIKFLIAMACLYECNQKNAWQLGLKYLFDLINDQSQYKSIKKLYSFTYLDLIRLTEEFDVYNLRLLVQRDQQILQLNENLGDRDQIIASLKRDLFECDGDIASLNQTIIESERQIADLKHENAKILASTSWRVTKPIRSIANRVRSFRSLLRLGVLMSVRFAGNVLRWLPVSTNIKNAMKDVAFSLVGWLFKHHPAYQVWYEIKQINQTEQSHHDQHELEGNPSTIPSNGLNLERVCKKILLIDATTPTPDRDAGSVTAFFFMKAFVELGYDVTFIPDDLHPKGRYTKDLCAIGVRCLTRADINSIEAFLIREGKSFDVAFLYRVHTARSNFPIVKKYAPNAKIVFDTVDMHFLREERQAGLDNSPDAIERARLTKNAEFEMMRIADATIVLSKAEYDIVKQHDPSLNVFILPLMLDIPGCKLPFAQRRHVVFIGGFLHQPNIDSIQYFVKDIWPLIRKKLPNTKLLIIGSNPPDEVTELGKNDNFIDVVGFVEDLDPYFDSCRISIAPLRFGAGIKGKIGTSASYGVPCVATSLAVEGMDLIDGVNVLVADEDENFADKVVKLYNNDELWNRISRNSLDFVKRNYSFDMGKTRLQNLLNSLGG
jgi:glycosyltransferase involved in cell wall biosynthesis